METQPDDLKTSNYCQVANGEKWRIPFVQELIDAKNGLLETNMSFDDLNMICSFVCSS